MDEDVKQVLTAMDGRMVAIEGRMGAMENQMVTMEARSAERIHDSETRLLSVFCTA